MNSPETANCGDADSKQRKAERYYFSRFREVYPLTAREVSFGDKPDVVLRGDRNIGVEITNFYLVEGHKPESEQRQRDRRDAIVSQAQAEYERGPHRNIELIFGFSESPIGRRAAQTALAGKLARIAKQVQDSERNGQIAGALLDEVPEVNFAYLRSHELECEPPPDPEYPAGPPDDFPGFKRYMDRRDLYIRRFGKPRPLLHPAKWRATKVHSGGLLPLDRLAEIVAGKEEKVRDYETCDAYWLLVVVDFLDPAQDREIRIEGFEKLHSTVFERVIVYRPYFEHVLDNSGLRLESA